MENKMEAIICSNVNKSYGKKEVLKNIDFTLEKGKIYGLIGRNGAGKTTLLSILSAQNPATEGNVTWNGEKIWENRKALDHICFSRELSTNLYGSGVSSLKVKEYLKNASYYYPNWDQKMADELIEKFELNTKQRINKMSKGMLSMVTIIVALASKADFTFLDEPVAGLDVVMREYFYHKLMEEYTETGRTFVISTHIIPALLYTSPSPHYRGGSGSDGGGHHDQGWQPFTERKYTGSAREKLSCQRTCGSGRSGSGRL